MRRYDIVSGIFLILSIIDFALAAPVLAQEKRQACVDVMHIPKDVMNVVEKRGKEELEKLLEQYFKSMGKPAESSDAHASSGSAAPGPDHGSTSMVQAPAPNPASSTASSNPLMGPSGPSAAAPMQGYLFPESSSGYLYPPEHPLSPKQSLPKPKQSPPKPKQSPLKKFKVPIFESSERNPPAPVPILKSSEVYASPSSAPMRSDHGSTNVVQAPVPILKSWEIYASPSSAPVPILKSWKMYVSPSSAPLRSDHGSTNVVQVPVPILESPEVYASPSSAPLRSDHGSTNVVQAPVPNPASPIADSDPYYPLMPAPMQGDGEVHGIPHALASTEYHPDHDMGWEQALQPDKRPWTDPDFNWDDLTNWEQHLESLGLALAKRPKYDGQVEHWQQPNPGPDADLNWDLWSNLDDEISRKQSLQKETGQAHDVSVSQPKPRSSTERESHVMSPPSESQNDSWDSESDPDDDEVVLGPPSSPYLKLHSDDQSRRARTLSW